MAKSSFYSGSQQASANSNAVEDSKNAAALSEASAAASAAASATSAASGAASATTATTKASESASSATASATSASASQVSRVASEAAKVASETAKTAAETARDAAAASSTSASSSQAAASASETNSASNAAAALVSENAAAASETAASASASAASTSETNAAASETAAAASETAAATSETNASTSETNAATSETNAATSETNAASSASSAASNASAASTSATSASNAQTAAEAARDATLTAYDNFDDRYLGAKASAPTVDNDGNALVAGALYFDSTAGAMKVYTGSSWVAAYVSGTDYLPFSGGTMTGDVAHGDNVKATFGNSADLQVYHDGSASRIVDNGPGDLYIQATDQLRLTTSDASESYLIANQNSGVTVYYDNLPRLNTTSSGIDVTGTVVADGATFDGAVYVNGSGVNLDDAYSLSWGDGSAQVRGSGSSEVVELRTSSLTRLQANAGGDISFYEDTGTTAKFFWDASAESLGIGTTSPSAKLQIVGVTDRSSMDGDLSSFQLVLNGSGNTTGNYEGGIAFADGSTDPTAAISPVDAGTSARSDLAFGTGDSTSISERMRITYDGNVGIGTTSPSEKLDVNGTAKATTFEVNGWTITESGGSLYFATGGTNKMKLDASGNLDVVGSVNSNATIT